MTAKGYKLIRRTHGHGGELLLGRTPYYAFYIHKESETSDWRLIAQTTALDILSREAFDLNALGKLSLGVIHPLGTSSPNMRVSHYLQEAKRLLVSARVTESASERQRTLSFQCSTGLSGTIQSSSDHPGVVMRSTSTFSPKPSARDDLFVRELMPDTDRKTNQLPYCKSIHYVAKSEQTNSNLMEVRVDFSDYSDKLPDERIFRLSHYGLPEPEGVVWPKKPNYSLWGFVGAGVLVLVALFFRRMQRRALRLKGA